SSRTWGARGTEGFHHHGRFGMRILCLAVLAMALVVSPMAAEEKAKEAPKIVLKSPDGKKTYDLSKLTADGPVLVRLTCACTGCDQEVAYFQKLQAAYNDKGLKTLALFKAAPEAVSSCAAKKGLNFLWLADPKGDSWKVFEAKTMPTNILLDKGGRVVKIVPGCTTNGKNAQILSGEIAKLLKTDEAKVVEPKKK